MQSAQCNQFPISLKEKWVKLDGEINPCGDHFVHTSDMRRTSWHGLLHLQRCGPIISRMQNLLAGEPS